MFYHLVWDPGQEVSTPDTAYIFLYNIKQHYPNAYKKGLHF